ncbi:hypothetical protein WDU94_001243 [Cyamophila willieti]
MDILKIIIWTFVVLLLMLESATSIFFDDEETHISKIRIHVFQPPPKIKAPKVVKHVHFNIHKPQPAHEEIHHPHEITIPITITPNIYSDHIPSPDPHSHDPHYSDHHDHHHDLHQSATIYPTHAPPYQSGFAQGFGQGFSQQGSLSTSYKLPSGPSGQLQYDPPQYDDLHQGFPPQNGQIGQLDYGMGGTGFGMPAQYGDDPAFESPQYPDMYPGMTGPTGRGVVGVMGLTGRGVGPTGRQGGGHRLPLNMQMYEIVLSFVAIFLDQSCAVIYERHIIHVPLYVHVVHHHHVREPKAQKIQKVPNFRPLPALPSPQQHQQQNQQLQTQNQFLPHQNIQNNPFPVGIIQPRLPEHSLQQNQQLQQTQQHTEHQQQQQQQQQQQEHQQKGRNPNADAQWVHPSQLNLMLNHQFNAGDFPPFPRLQRPGGRGQQAKSKKQRGPPLSNGGKFQQLTAAPGGTLNPRPQGAVGAPPVYYSTVYSNRPGAYRMPSNSVKYVARHRSSAADDLSSYWYAYG